MRLVDYKPLLTEELKPRTGLYFIKNGKILLGRKKKGFGKDKLLGIGGKVDAGETIAEAVSRECLEEVRVKPIGFQKIAIIDFYFPLLDKFKFWNQQVIYYVARDWEGEITETEEIFPAWFDITKIPFAEMWPDAQYYLPSIVAGNYIEAEFLYNENIELDDWKLR